jgi:hypothetical protein
MVEARRHDGNARGVCGELRRGWKGRKVQCTRRVLFECPHRRTQSKSADDGSSVSVGSQLLIAFEKRNAMLHLLKSFQEFLAEFVVHFVAYPLP